MSIRHADRLRTSLRLIGFLVVIAGTLPLPAVRLGPLDPRRIVHEEGQTFLYDIRELGVTAPSDAEGGSAIRLLENDRSLYGGRAHDEIRAQGGGRFSHWGPRLYFSSTDQSDPRTSGHSYVLLIPRSVLDVLGPGASSKLHGQLVLVGTAVLFLATLRGPLRRILARLAAGAAAVALAPWSLPAGVWALAGLTVFSWPEASTSSSSSDEARARWSHLAEGLVAAAAVLAGLLHAYALGTTRVGWDEGFLLAQTENLLQGRRLYAEVMTQYPPGIYLVLVPVLALWHSLTAARLVAGAFHLGIALVAALLARRLSADALAPWTAGALWLCCATAFEADTLMSDPFSTLPAFAALAWLVLDPGAIPSRRRCVGAGVLLAAGALSKQIGILWAAPAAALLLSRFEAPLRLRLDRLASLMAGGALLGLPVLAYLAVTPRALFDVVLYSLSNRYAAETSLAALRDAMTSPRWTIALILLFLAAIARRRARSSLPLILWLAVLVNLVPFIKKPYAHYALPSLAALCVLAGGGMGRLATGFAPPKRRIAVAAWAAAGLLLAGQAAREMNAVHTLGGLHTRQDDLRLAARLRDLAPVGAEVLSTWPFAAFANRYRSPVRFAYDLAGCVPGDFWLEEWRDLGRRPKPAEIVIVRSRRNIYDLAAVLWRQIEPDEPLLPSAREPVRRPLRLPPVLWYARHGDREIQLALAGSAGATVALRGVAGASAIHFQGDWAEPARTVIRAGEPFLVSFAGPQDSWHLARAFAEDHAPVRWEGAWSSPP